MPRVQVYVPTVRHPLATFHVLLEEVRDSSPEGIERDALSTVDQGDCWRIETMAKRGRPAAMDLCVCSHEWICHMGGAPCFCGCRQFEQRGGKLPKWQQKLEDVRVRRAQMRVIGE